MKTNMVLSQVDAGQNPDAIMYDPFSKKIITCNGRSKDLSVIDPVTNKVVATIPVGGKPETAVSNEAGKIYVNIEDKNEIIAVNIQTNTVENRYDCTAGRWPHRAGYRLEQTNRLFAGCDKTVDCIGCGKSGKIVDKPHSLAMAAMAWPLTTGIEIYICVLR